MGSYDVSKNEKGVWYAHRSGWPGIPVLGSFGSKKRAMFIAGNLMGLTYEQYVEWRKKYGRKSHK